MKKVFLGVVFYILGLALAMCVSSIVVEAKQWSEGASHVVSRAPVSFTYADGLTLCSGTEEVIEVKGFGVRNQTCVFGTSHQLRFARFLEKGQFKYAVSFPRQSDFTEIYGVCATVNCVYSPTADMLIEHVPIGGYHYGAVLHKKVSQKMLKQTDWSSGRDYYRLNTDDEFGVPIRNQEYTYVVNAVNFSNNGKWAILELPTFGFVRLNTETLAMRRVVAPGADYGLMNDPNYELAISNDGAYFATTGYRVGTSVYEITNTCGGQIDLPIQKYFQPPEVNCKAIQGFNGLFEQAFAGYNLRFDDAARRLGVSIMHRDGRRERVILSQTQSSTGLEYIALGDSFSSGEGEVKDSFYKVGSNDTGNKCHVSLRSYPYLLASKWGIHGENVACSGARTGDIFGDTTYFGQYSPIEGAEKKSVNQAISTYQPGIARQAEFISSYLPQVASIGIGGNDAGLVGKLASCLGPGDCEWVTDLQKKAATANEIAGVFYQVRTMLRFLKQSSPHTKFFTVGYPKIIDSSDTAKCDAVTQILLSHSERVFIDESVRYLNQVIEAASNAEGVRFVHIQNSFSSHELCGRQDSSMMNGVRFGDDIPLPVQWLPFRIFGAESYHPTPKGHVVIADAIHDTFNTYGSITPCEECKNRGELPKPSEYWAQKKTQATHRQYENTSITQLVYKPGDTLGIKLPELTFLRNTKVGVEIHSTPRIVLRDSADSLGAFSAEVMVPIDIEEGYHVLHIVGTAADGVEVDIYRTIAVIKDIQQASATAPAHEKPLNSKGVTDITTTALQIPRSEHKSTSSQTGIQQQLSVLGVNTKAPTFPTEKLEFIRKSNDNIGLLVVVVAVCLVIIVFVALIIRKPNVVDS